MCIHLFEIKMIRHILKNWYNLDSVHIAYKLVFVSESIKFQRNTFLVFLYCYLLYFISFTLNLNHHLYRDNAKLTDFVYRQYSEIIWLRIMENPIDNSISTRKELTFRVVFQQIRQYGIIPSFTDDMVKFMDAECLSHGYITDIFRVKFSYAKTPEVATHNSGDCELVQSTCILKVMNYWFSIINQIKMNRNDMNFVFWRHLFIDKAH